MSSFIKDITDLNTINNVELVISNDSDIARGKPTISECAFGCLLVAEVPLSHDWATEN
jgi:hypothetical protein